MSEYQSVSTNSDEGHSISGDSNYFYDPAKTFYSQLCAADSQESGKIIFLDYWPNIGYEFEFFQDLVNRLQTYSSVYLEDLSVKLLNDGLK